MELVSYSLPMGWMIRVQFLEGGKAFSLYHNIQTIFGATKYTIHCVRTRGGLPPVIE
jgi:hypothetical protein